ncbi:MAG: hypothetical protein GY938_16200 [Ketobacter sp.]|nr:hypothetical protein [Ketobacter sp.]
MASVEFLISSASQRHAGVFRLADPPQQTDLTKSATKSSPFYFKSTFQATGFI